MMNSNAGGQATPMAGPENTLHISADMLPKGTTLNPGDTVEFKVSGPADQDGDWPLEYSCVNPGSDGDNDGDTDNASGDSGGDESSWEDDFRKSMSPTQGGEAMDQAAS